MADCPLCAANADLSDFSVTGGPADASVGICAICANEIDGEPEANHWRGLASSMWSEDAATQVLAARMLNRLSQSTDWARDLLDQLYLDEDLQAWVENEALKLVHKDSNGATLSAGDTVVLIKDLPVKGAGFTAKRGTAVRGISLVADNAGHIEGRVEGQRIEILTEFVKKK
ncbi:MAG: alkylphosphonate utilization protein [Paracoccaceae bacterium]|nr:alkylphosphonate utilization protein [Paracoccaceae bacterium]MDG1736853.1 alkylphosphonate utilization protein [Paracoccaceae bacterium]MDG2260477.1 alkylphosphonate utilization protein [Paracoccaceae bacterium]